MSLPSSLLLLSLLWYWSYVQKLGWEERKIVVFMPSFSKKMKSSPPFSFREMEGKGERKSGLEKEKRKKVVQIWEKKKSHATS